MLASRQLSLTPLSTTGTRLLSFYYNAELDELLTLGLISSPQGIPSPLGLLGMTVCTMRGRIAFLGCLMRA